MRNWIIKNGLTLLMIIFAGGTAIAQDLKAKEYTDQAVERYFKDQERKAKKEAEKQNS